jgi:hypothetical protein
MRRGAAVVVRFGVRVDLVGGTLVELGAWVTVEAPWFVVVVPCLVVVVPCLVVVVPCFVAVEGGSTVGGLIFTPA